MEKLKINDTVKLGTWDEVENLELSTITLNDKDTEKLNGLVIRGYEMKFGESKNANGEVYEKGAFDDFIQDYFVERGLNMPVTIDHRGDIQHLCGRVLLIETNSVGFYFVVYIPKSYMHYDAVKSLIREGILQGFSKEGWATDYEYKYNASGEYEYMLIKKIDVTCVSIVSTPANALRFEKVQEKAIENKLTFKAQNDVEEEQPIESAFDDMFI